MKKNKRKDKKGAVNVAAIEESVQAVQEEKRLLGVPLKESNDLFVEDRSGQDHIRNRLGFKKELTIDRILKPSSNISVPKQRILSTKKKPVIQKVRAYTPAKPAGEVKEDQGYDIWRNTEDKSNKSVSRRKDASNEAERAKPAAQLYSYRPRLPDHLDKLVELEAAMQERAKRNLVVPITNQDQITEKETMEDRANRELVEGVCDSVTPSNNEVSQQNMLENQPEKNKILKKKTRRERNKDRDERIAREHRMRQQAQKSLLSDINLAKHHAKALRQSQAAEQAFHRLATSEMSSQKEAGHVTIPLLPGEVPETLRALPSSHANPIAEQYRRLTAY